MKLTHIRNFVSEAVSCDAGVMDCIILREASQFINIYPPKQTKASRIAMELSQLPPDMVSKIEHCSLKFLQIVYFVQGCSVGLHEIVQVFRFLFSVTVCNISASDNYCISHAATLNNVWETILSLAHTYYYETKKSTFSSKTEEGTFNRVIANSLLLVFFLSS